MKKITYVCFDVFVASCSFEKNYNNYLWELYVMEGNV